MTPLAHAFSSALTSTKNKRRLNDEIELGFDILSFAFFEVTEIFAAATEIGEAMYRDPERSSQLGFLPAPKTWIERRLSNGERVAWLLQEHQGGCTVHNAVMLPDGFIHLSRNGTVLSLAGTTQFGRILNMTEDDRRLLGTSEGAWLDRAPEIIGTLAMINTPRIIGRRQHMPHAGLQRKLAAARGMVGKFPLQAWTEIILEVTPPAIDDGEPHEARLTGGKALHFCRSHLRVRRGQLELVKAHWRGDPALGIKRSRYSVVPPKNAA